MRVGMRFVMHTHALQVVLIRGGAFFVFASATWSLFPLIVRRELGRGPEIYGLLLTCIGVGAVAGAMLLPRVRARFSRDALVAGASVLYALAALALAHVQNIGAARGRDAGDRRRLDLDPLRAAGVGANDAAVVGARTRTGRVRRRLHGRHGARQHLLGTGRDADRHSRDADDGGRRHGDRHRTDLALQARAHEVLDFTPSMEWPAARPRRNAGARRAGHGHDRISGADRDKRAEFVAAMQAVREMRRRNGAYFWQLFHDSADPTRFVECFMDESWVEHLRQHERVERRRPRDPATREAVHGRRRDDAIAALARRPRIVIRGAEVGVRARGPPEVAATARFSRAMRPRSPAFAFPAASW